MNQENRDLLLRDLCGRLPYGVKVQVIINGTVYQAGVYAVFGDGTVYVEYENSLDAVDISEVRPYLFPLSALSTSDKNEITNILDCNFPWEVEEGKINWTVGGLVESEQFTLTIDQVERLSDWFNKKHFDYRGLIGKDSALDATRKGIY